MAMPLPISVAIVCSSCDELNRPRRKVKVSEPGVAPIYHLVALDKEGKRIITPEKVPPGEITLWLALDEDAFEFAWRQHAEDRQHERYERGFYDELLPEPVVLIENEPPGAKRFEAIETWIDRVRDAFYKTS